MKIVSVTSLEIPEVKVIRFQRFGDNRGYFTEIYRKSDFNTHPQTQFLKDFEFTQINESYSQKGVIKGMHFQWDPYMGKLVRTVNGSMVDLFLDIRKGSPTFGKAGAYKMSADHSRNENEWIRIPVGFAHGNYYTEDTTIEYLCTGQWAPETERSISPLSKDIDWSLINQELKKEFDELSKNPIMTEKDKSGMSVLDWSKDTHSQLFTYTESS